MDEQERWEEEQEEIHEQAVREGWSAGQTQTAVRRAEITARGE